MAEHQDLLAHFTEEQIEAIRALIQGEVVKILLKSTFEDRSWLADLAKVEMQQAVEQVRQAMHTELAERLKEV